MSAFFDTNVLVYLFDQDAPEKKARAQLSLERESARDGAIISTQVLQEFYAAYLFSEDLQNGQVVNGVEIRNPFLEPINV